MAFITVNRIKYLQFDLFSGMPVVQAVFTRHGGVSDSPFNSLNLGGNIGDSDTNIIENKKRIFEALKLPFESQYDVWQVHGDHVVIPEGPRKPLQPYLEADGILTDSAEITMVMRFADCVPILLYEPHKHIAGIVHAGWQGTLKNTVGAAISKMIQVYAVKSDDIVAAIGPSIGPDHYSIRQDLLLQIQSRFQMDWQKMIQFDGDKIFFDLWKANEINLLQGGVTKVETVKLCTACHTEDWYSHRAEHGRTGRFGALIKLNG